MAHHLPQQQRAGGPRLGAIDLSDRGSATKPIEMPARLLAPSALQNGGFPELDIMRDVWQALYSQNVDVVVNGHDHLYEVFAEQNPQGFPEPGRGIREFIVGTGGAPSYRFVANKPNSQKQITNRYAVIRFTLLADSYQWSLLEAPSGGVLDSGTGTCH
jgi:hypothetical protein